MDVIEQMALYGTPEQKAAAAEWAKHRWHTDVFERVHAQLCDERSELSREVDRALMSPSLAYSACANRLVGD